MTRTRDALRSILERAEAMLRQHYNWSEGVYVRRPEAGRDEDLVIVDLPNKVRIVDMADDLRDARAALAEEERQEGELIAPPPKAGDDR